MAHPVERPLERALARTGIDGLDRVLHGGLQRDRVYLVERDPGTGKTTLGV
jgi:circadian clock protein KaiC